MIPLNLGIRAHDLHISSREELGAKLLQQQFTHIQLALNKSFPHLVPSLANTSSGTANYIGGYLQQLGIKISVLGCYVNIASLDQSTRQAALATFKHQITLAKDYPATVVGTETGSVTGGYTIKNFTEEAYKIARDSVIDLVSFAEHFGVIVGIEPGINHPLYTYQLTKRLVDEVQSPNLKIILDCANLISLDNYRQQEYITSQALEILHDHICSIHLKDFIIENNQVKIVPVGSGWMKYHHILAFLKHNKPLMFASLEATKESELPLAINCLQETYSYV